MPLESCIYILAQTEPCVEQQSRNTIWKRLVIVAPTPKKDKNMTNQFSSFFLNKMEKIGVDLDAIQVLSPLNNSNDNNTLPPESLLDFASVNDEIVSKIIRNSPVKSCILDPLPTHVLLMSCPGKPIDKKINT